MTVFELPTEVVEVLLAAKHCSTTSMNAGSWNKFVCFGARNTDPLQAKVSDILLYVLSLAQQGLAVDTAVDTVDVYLSAR